MNKIKKAAGFIYRMVRHPIERMPSFLAGWYDERIMKGLFFDWYKEVAGATAAEIARGDILDIGTGAGYIPIFIAEKAPHLRVVGIDPAKRMIRRARKHAVEHGAGGNLSFQPGDANRLEFAPDSFDIVLNTMAVHCLRKPLNMLNEIYRVLKKNGKVRLYDIRPYNGSETDRQMIAKIRKVSPWFLRPFITEKSMTQGGYTPAEIEEFFRQSKFQQWRYREKGIFFQFSAEKI